MLGDSPTCMEKSIRQEVHEQVIVLTFQYGYDSFPDLTSVSGQIITLIFLLSLLPRNNARYTSDVTIIARPSSAYLSESAGALAPHRTLLFSRLLFAVSHKHQMSFCFKLQTKALDYVI